MTRRASMHWVAAVALATATPLTGTALAQGSGPRNGPAASLSDRASAALGLERSSIVNVMLDGAASRQVLAVAPIRGIPAVMLLEPVSVRAEGYQLLVQGKDGRLRPAKAGPERTLRGTILGVEGSTVAASLLDDGLHARVLFPDGEDYWLEPIAGRVAGANANEYAVYRGDDTLSPGACGLETEAAMQPALEAGDGVAQLEYEGGAAGTGGCVAQLACDADVEYFEQWGSVSAVEARISSVINAVNIQYARDANITHAITAIVVRTAEPDPYTKKPADQLLFEFRNEWETNRTSIPRDLAQLFTGRDLAGNTIGIAWLGSVCTDLGYSVVQSDFSSSFSCVTDLSAHETGHNWGADHCSCPGYTMNPSITCANRFHPTFTVPDIVAHRDSRPCLDECGGTGPVCGDGVCDPGEDPCNCPADCGPPPVEVCSDGIDNDCDGLADCLDPECADDAGCQGGQAIVDCITYRTRGGPGGNRHLEVTVTIVDGTDAPVANAGVSMTLTGGGSYDFGGATDENGEVVFTLINAANTCYTSDVTGVSGAGLAFSGAEPANGFEKGADSTPDTDCRNGSDPCGSG